MLDGDSITQSMDVLGTVVPTLGFQIGPWAKFGLTWAYQIGYAAHCKGKYEFGVTIDAQLPEDALIALDMIDMKQTTLNLDKFDFKTSFDIRKLETPGAFDIFGMAVISFGIEVMSNKVKAKLELPLPLLGLELSPAKCMPPFISKLSFLNPSSRRRALRSWRRRHWCPLHRQSRNSRQAERRSWLGRMAAKIGSRRIDGMIWCRRSDDKANQLKPEFSKDLMAVQCFPLALGVITESGAMVPPGQSVPGAPRKKKPETNPTPESKPTPDASKEPFVNPFDNSDFSEYFDGDPPKLEEPVDPKETLLNDLDSEYFPQGSQSPQEAQNPQYLQRVQSSPSFDDPRQLEREVVLMPVAEYDQQNLIAFVDLTDQNTASIPNDDPTVQESDKTVDLPASDSVITTPSSTPMPNTIPTFENPMDELDTIVNPSSVAAVPGDEPLTERVAQQEDFGLSSLIDSMDFDYSFPTKLRRQLVPNPYPGPEGWGGPL